MKIVFENYKTNKNTSKQLNKRKQESSLKEDWNNDFVSDVYNALSDVMFKWHKKGYDMSQDEMNQAYEWFDNQFWDVEDYMNDEY